MERCIQYVSVLAALVVATTTEYITQTFTDTTNMSVFNHLAINKNTGEIYIGAVNRMYQLTEDVVEIRSITTGPQYDNPNCPPDGSSDCGDYVRTHLDSYNKALAIDYDAGRLFSCTNLFQGHCVKYDLKDISIKYDPIFTVIVSNNIFPNEHRSVVMFVAPGPINNDNVLYSAVTRSHTGLRVYKDLTPAISSRNLETFQLASSGFTAATKIDFTTQHRDLYRVYYIYGFSSGGFSYFLSVQKQSLDVTARYYVTRIIRVCQNDPSYYSYTEVPLECNHDGENYNILRAAYKAHPGGDLARDLGLADIPPHSDMDDVLFGLFAKNTGQTIGPHSVLCVFPLQTIRRIFTESIQTCFNGIGNTGPGHIVSPQPCTPTTFRIDDNYCGQYEFNTPIAGSEAVSADAVLFMEATVATSIAVMVTYEYTVAFIGTVNGQLKKVVIENGSAALEYETISVDEGSPINMDMGFDRNLTHVYVMSEKKLSKVKVEECSQYTSCVDCLGAEDPFCGWCVLENRCSLRSECLNSDTLHHWLPYSGDQCPGIFTVIPNQVQITPNAVSRLTLKVQSLPNTNYQCAFSKGLVSQTTTAHWVGGQNGDLSSLQCDTPSSNMIPTIPPGTDNVVMELSLRTSDQIVVSRNFTFFDCESQDSCTGCTTSNFPCSWCVQNHVCTADRVNCVNDVLITGQNVPGLTDHPGPQSCPRIEADFNEILIPSAREKHIAVRAINLQDFQGQFKCYFGGYMDQEVTAVKRNGDLIECEPVFFQYDVQTSPYISVPLDVTWGEGDSMKALDNLGSIHVQVYKCEVMADKCGRCLMLDPKYKCGWCNDHCSIEQQCHAGTWLDSSQDCPDLFITSFEPQKGPRQGGTVFTIEGENLGIRFEDIQGGITVAGVPCTPDELRYEPAVKVICTTGESSIDTTGPVEITIGSYISNSSNKHFNYVTPIISSFHPQKGPQSGGTLVTIQGQYLDAGTVILAKVVGLPCVIKSTIGPRVICQTQRNAARLEGLVQIAFDNAEITFTEDTYQYVEDPEIVDVSRHKSILSGGLLVNVFGTNLDSVQYPKMYVNHQGMEFFGDCTLKSADEMTCHTPNITALQEGGPQEEITIPYGFIMDNVMELRNLTAYTNGRLRLSFYHDPIFLPFEDDIMYFPPKYEYLTIDGENLNLVLTNDDVTVLIGDARCNVTSIADTQLTCRPPTPEPEALEHNPVVTVLVGKLSFPLGMLLYENTPIQEDTAAWIGIIAGCCLFIIIIVVVVIIKCNSKHGWMPCLLHNNKTAEVPHEMWKLMTDTANGCDRESALKTLDGDLREDILECLIDSSRAQVIREIGRGNFGRVYAGVLTSIDPTGQPLPVAIKTLKDTAFHASSICEFLREAIIMKDFDHENVLHLIGVVIEKNYVVLPFMENGDLRSFISEPERILSVRNLLGYGLQAARGMEYLEQQKFVHRDVAARNCMVDSDLCVKVADFGLARDMYERDYYRPDDLTRPLPVKWTALECLDGAEFTTKSDVWSFGVLLWEILTRGRKPYNDVNNFNMKVYLKSGRRLEPPEFCPPRIFDLMTQCWHTDRDERPTFTYIVSELDHVLHGPTASKSNDVRFEMYLSNDVQQPEDYLSPISNTDASQDRSSAGGQSSETPYTHGYLDLLIDA